MERCRTNRTHETKVSSFIKRGLEENGLTVTQAFDGLTGYHLAQRNKFDVVILDIIIPEMNGLEVCRKLKEEFGSELSILMLTQYPYSYGTDCINNKIGKSYFSSCHCPDGVLKPT